MKIISLLVILFVSLIEGNELYYYAGGEKIYLHTYKDKISVTWQEDVTLEDKENILRSKPEIKSWYDIEKYPVTILEADEDKAQILLEELCIFPQVEFAHFILHTGQNDSTILTNELIVKLTPAISIEEICNMGSNLCILYVY